MANLRSQHTDNHARNQNGLSRDNRESSEDKHSDPASPLPDLKSVSPPPMPQTVLDRLSAKLEQEQTNTTDNLQQQSLEELGVQIRQWRLKQGYTRALLASMLQIDEEQLLCIENGIVKAGQISKGDLLTLQGLLNEDEEDKAVHSLSAAIHRYLALPKP
jgi:hypothetical protein